METQAFPGFHNLCLGGMVCFLTGVVWDPSLRTQNLVLGGWSLGAWNLAVQAFSLDLAWLDSSLVPNPHEACPCLPLILAASLTPV